MAEDALAFSVLELAAKVICGVASDEERGRVRGWSKELAAPDNERLVRERDLLVGVAEQIRQLPDEIWRADLTRTLARTFAQAVGHKRRLEDVEVDRLVALLDQIPTKGEIEALAVRREAGIAPRVSKRGRKGEPAKSRTVDAVLVDVMLLLDQLKSDDPGRLVTPADKKNFATRLQRKRART